MERKIAIVACNGMSPQGRLVAKIVEFVRAQLDDVEIIDLVPLLAQVPETIQRAQQADLLVGLAGCEKRCDQLACKLRLQRIPDHDFVAGAHLPNDPVLLDSLSEAQRKEQALTDLSELLGQLQQL